MGDDALARTKKEQSAYMWDWKLVRNYRGNLIIKGRVFNDATKRFIDHEQIVTTPIQVLDILGDGTYVAETLNTQYILVTLKMEDDILQELRQRTFEGNPYDEGEMDRFIYGS